MAAASERIAVGLIWSGSRVVVGKRGAGSALAGLDEFPGGKCLPGESPEAACVRECAEETGLSVHVITRRSIVEHEYPHGLLRIFFFDCEPANANEKLHPPFRWVEVNDLSRLQFPEANRIVLDGLRID
jgi:mutator protein MutT